MIQNKLAPILPLSLTQQTGHDLFTRFFTALNPAFLYLLFFRFSNCRHTIVFSNVMGPGEEIKLAGKTIKGMQMLFPNLIMQTGVFFR